MKTKILAAALLAGIGLYSCRKPTEACFTFSPTAINTNTDVTFDASCSQNAGRYVWSFGDNSDSSTTSPTIIHRFSASGTYTVSLGVQSADGKSSGTDKLVVQGTVTVQ